ncbi:MAG: proton-conducting transporter membrane subunit [Sedimentisphaerales bacterium]|jgi:multicomponent Na+:H+ antiporter subunit D
MLSPLLLTPILAIMILNLPFRSITKRISFGLGLLLSVGQIIAVILPALGLFDKSDVWTRFFTFGLHCDNLTLVLLLSIGIVVFTVILVGWQTIKGEKQRFGFVNLVLVAMVGMNGTVMLSDLFSLYVFIEITAVSSFILIASQRNLNALEGAFKYIMMSATATIMMLLSISILLLVSGDTSFASVGGAIRQSEGNPLVMFAIGIFICGLLIKGGMVPFHGWLPAAYSAAPAAVSVLLAGIATKASGIYALIRLTTSVFAGNESINHVLLIAGTVSILVGAFAALGQSDFKRMLAYSSISQVGYIILGLGCGTNLGIVGAVFHLFNHSIFKSLLFVNSAAVEQQSGTTDMNKLGGLGAKMPVTSVTSLIAFLSTAGVPPMAGFWSKLIIVIALWQNGLHTYAVIAVLASILTLAYLLLMQRKVFFGILADGLQNVREAGFGIVLPSSILAAITLGVGLVFPWIFNGIVMPISNFLK